MLTRLPPSNAVICDAPSPRNALRIDHGCLPMVRDMHRRGILLDTARMAELDTRLAAEQLDNLKAIEHTWGKPLNPASPKQVAQTLWRDLRVQGDKQIPYTPSGGETTDNGTLELFKHSHPLVPLIIRGRELSKLRGGYTIKLPKMIDSASRIHTRFKHTTVTTGRFASENPNLQNIPARSAEGIEIRNCFGAPPGYTLIACDFSQIEMRVAAHLAQDANMIELLNSGIDIHTKTACSIWGMKYDPALKDDPEFKQDKRLPAKTVGFGVLYLMGPDGLVLAIVEAGGEEWPRTKAEALLKGWYAQYPEIAKWQTLQFTRARRFGAVWTMFGRIRPVPEVRSVHKWIRNAGLRQAANQPVQGSAQDIMKLAMAEVQALLVERRASGIDVWPLLQVHDELVLECPTAHAQEIAHQVGVLMSNVVELLVPTPASANIGETWGQLK